MLGGITTSTVVMWAASVDITLVNPVVLLPVTVDEQLLRIVSGTRDVRSVRECCSGRGDDTATACRSPASCSYCSSGQLCRSGHLLLQGEGQL